MKNIMPSSVLLNRTRGLQAVDLIWRIRDNYNEIEELLTKLSRSDKVNSIINIGKMRRILIESQTVANQLLWGETTTILLRGMDTALYIDLNDH